MTRFLFVTATCLFFSAGGTPSFGIDSDRHHQIQESQESSNFHTQQGTDSSIDTESSSTNSKQIERQRKLRPGDAGKKGVTSVFGGHRTGSPATRNSGANKQPNQ